MIANKKVLFIGSKKIGFLTMKTLSEFTTNSICGILTIDDRDDRRTYFNEIINYAKEKDLPILIARNRKESEKFINDANPDCCFVAGWYWIISKQILDRVPMGVIGIHYSLLPKYRGFAPLVWSIINGDDVVGASIFSFVEKMDAGSIWKQIKVNITDEHFIGDVQEKIERAAIDFLKKNWDAILLGKTIPTTQNEDSATFCCRRLPADGKINWNDSSVNILNFIRAQSKPYPGAHTYYNGKKLIVWTAGKEKTRYFGVPGQVASISNGGIYIICGDMKTVMLKKINYHGTDQAANDLIKHINTRLSNSP